MFMDERDGNDGNGVSGIFFGAIFRGKGKVGVAE